MMHSNYTKQSVIKVCLLGVILATQWVSAQAQDLGNAQLSIPINSGLPPSKFLTPVLSWEWFATNNITDPPDTTGGTTSPDFQFQGLRLTRNTDEVSVFLLGTKSSDGRSTLFSSLPDISIEGDGFEVRLHGAKIINYAVGGNYHRRASKASQQEVIDLSYLRAYYRVGIYEWCWDAQAGTPCANWP